MFQEVTLFSRIVSSLLAIFSKENFFSQWPAYHLGHNRIGTWNMKYPLLPSKVRVFNGQFFKSFLNDLIMLFDQTNIPVLSVIKVIFQFQCATWISSLTTISIQWPTSWSLEGKIIKTSEGTSGRGCDFLNVEMESFLRKPPYLNASLSSKEK